MGMGHDLIDDMAEQRRFPIQGGFSIKWEAAARAYSHYVSRYGSGQTLERLAERGGFGLFEYVSLYHYHPPERWNHSAMGRNEYLIEQALREGDFRTEQKERV